jgi:serine protease Do
MSDNKPAIPTLHVLVHIIEIALLALVVWRLFYRDSPWERVYNEHATGVVEISSGIMGESSGTGFVFNAGSGPLIVTCRHVVAGSPVIKARFSDGYDAYLELIDSSEKDDIAVFRPAKNERKLTNYPEFKEGDVQALRIGEQVMAIGYPINQTNHISIGFFSGQGHASRRDQTYLFLSMPVDPGNSGGPVLDKTGRVIGIVSAKIQDSANIAFAVPITSLGHLFLNTK